MHIYAIYLYLPYHNCFKGTCRTISTAKLAQTLVLPSARNSRKRLRPEAAIRFSETSLKAKTNMTWKNWERTDEKTRG